MSGFESIYWSQLHYIYSRFMLREWERYRRRWSDRLSKRRFVSGSAWNFRYFVVLVVLSLPVPARTSHDKRKKDHPLLSIHAPVIRFLRRCIHTPYKNTPLPPPTRHPPFTLTRSRIRPPSHYHFSRQTHNQTTVLSISPSFKHSSIPL